MYDPSSGNPFAERPSTAAQNEMQRVATEAALAELDRPNNAPDVVEPHVWERLCQYRRQKVGAEPARVESNASQVLRHQEQMSTFSVFDVSRAFNELSFDQTLDLKCLSRNWHMIGAIHGDEAVLTKFCVFCRSSGSSW